MAGVTAHSTRTRLALFAYGSALLRSVPGSNMLLPSQKKMHCNFSKPSGKLSLSFFPGTVKKTKGVPEKKGEEKNGRKKTAKKNYKKNGDPDPRNRGDDGFKSPTPKIEGGDFFPASSAPDKKRGKKRENMVPVLSQPD